MAWTTRGILVDIVSIGVLQISTYKTTHLLEMFCQDVERVDDAVIIYYFVGIYTVIESVRL